uniref:Histone deacetylase n=1 Tax=Strongyloides venezuelensis TaxID=75913 RepID=A0A0K0FZ78_STRVS
MDAVKLTNIQPTIRCIIQFNNGHPYSEPSPGSIHLRVNSRPHVSKTAIQKLNELGFKTLSHSGYSSDLVTTNFYLFKHHDIFLSKKIFQER